MENEDNRLEAAEELINSIAPVLFPVELYGKWARSGGIPKPNKSVIQEEALHRAGIHVPRCVHCRV